MDESGFQIPPVQQSFTQTSKHNFFVPIQKGLAANRIGLIYLFIWRESKGTIESDGERGDRIKANVNGYTFYIII